MCRNAVGLDHDSAWCGAKTDHTATDKVVGGSEDVEIKHKVPTLRCVILWIEIEVSANLVVNCFRDFAIEIYANGFLFAIVPDDELCASFDAPFTKAVKKTESRFFLDVVA